MGEYFVDPGALFFWTPFGKDLPCVAPSGRPLFGKDLPCVAPSGRPLFGKDLAGQLPDPRPGQIRGGPIGNVVTILDTIW